MAEESFLADDFIRQLMSVGEVDLLVGDASKSRRVLGWEPKTRFQDLVKEMVLEDVRQCSRA